MIGGDHRAGYRPDPKPLAGERSASGRTGRPVSDQVIRLFTGRERFYEAWEPDDE